MLVYTKTVRPLTLVAAQVTCKTTFNLTVIGWWYSKILSLIIIINNNKIIISKWGSLSSVKRGFGFGFQLNFIHTQKISESQREIKSLRWTTVRCTNHRANLTQMAVRCTSRWAIMTQMTMRCTKLLSLRWQWDALTIDLLRLGWYWGSLTIELRLRWQSER